MKQKLLLLFIPVLVLLGNVKAQQVIFTKPAFNTFSLLDAVIYVDEGDYELVQKTALLFQADVEAVTGKKLPLIHKINKPYKTVIAIGSITQSSLMKEMVANKKISIIDIKDKWEAYKIQSIGTSTKSAFIQNILAITGSDRRGVAYGVFELSKQIGVSPWYWWADVPVKKHSALYVKPSITISDAPKVKYRGIFINDEAPAFTGWAKEKFGAVNHKVYEKVFELLLRLKGNYLWPAMWGNAFNADDTLNPIKADEWGIVMGTSHHEPMLRSQQEWRRYGSGKWDYDSNEVNLKAFWKKGIENMGFHESIITMGMRGDGDEPMSETTATALLEKIVKDQRQIIETVTNKPASQTPQLWALYKEVQDYYDKGMRVPDDITLLLCDDNWGNIRKLPRPNEKPRKGGYGIYYHFDYVGGPRNYKWVNTNPITKVWEQMHLAYQHNVKQIWLVNVGDIKPMEFPISFYLDYAWNPEKITADDLEKYTQQWAAAQFGHQHAKDIATIIALYTKYNGRRKPELLDANTYSFNYDEWPRIVNEYNQLLQKAEQINRLLPQEYNDAYFQLVLHPVKACANLNEMYYNVALNKRAYANKWASTNQFADKVKQLYINDSLITQHYHLLNNGKWNHMMSQKHIGYTNWQEPRFQKMPDVKYLSQEGVTAPADALAAGKTATYPKNKKYPLFFEQDNYISIDANHFTKTINTADIKWKVLPDYGRTCSAITSFPVTTKAQVPAKNTAHVQYEVYTYSTGSFSINAYVSPTLNFYNAPEGVQYAISVDDEVPQIVSINKEDKNSISGIWNKWVSENIIIKTTQHKLIASGKHTVKYWMVNSAVVLQKLVLDFGGLKPSYLGPLETSNIQPLKN